MFELNYVVLFAAATVAGAVNAVAGGGTLLTFPSLLWAGQLAIVANATSTVALWPGSLSSFWGYRGELGNRGRDFFVLAVPSLLGGVLGALLLLRTSNATFAALVPWRILLATLLFVVQEPVMRRLRRREEPAAAPHAVSHSPMRWVLVLVFQFCIGIYGGYFGAGIGILMLAAFGFLGFTNIHHMNALKNLNNLCMNGVAATLFIGRGLVDWRLALLMAIGATLGGYAGAGTALRLGQKNVRRMVVAIGFGLSAWLLIR